MVLPAFSLPPATEIEVGDPILASHPSKWNDALDHVEQWIGKDYTATENHNHDGTDSLAVAASTLSGTIAEAQYAAGSVDQTALKTAQEEQTTGSMSSGGTATLTFSSIGEYGFWCEMKSNNISQEFRATPYLTNSTSYLRTIQVTAITVSSSTCSVRIRYVTSSPPYRFGDLVWPDAPWRYLLRRGDEVLRAWVAGDCPWYLRHRGRFPKDDPEAMYLRPHPFVDDFPELPPGSEVQLLDLRHLGEMVRRTPAADAYRAVLERRQARIEMGIPPDEIEAAEQRAARAARVEASKHAQAERDEQAVAPWVESRIFDIARDTRTPEARKRIIRARVHDLAAIKVKEARAAQGWTQRHRVIQAALEAQGESLLSALSKGLLPDADACTRCISTDPTAAEHRHIPHLFRKQAGDARPAIRILAPR